MTDRHATTADLPDWPSVDTVLGIAQTPGAHGWFWLENLANPNHTQGIGRDLAGRLYAASDAEFNDRPSAHAANSGFLALLVGVDDGLALWVPALGYTRIKPIDPDEPSGQPDVPRWLPIREVLKGIPDGMRP